MTRDSWDGFLINKPDAALGWKEQSLIDKIITSGR